MTSSSRTTVLFSIALCALACSKSEPATSTQASSTVASSTVSTTAAPPPAAPAPAPDIVTTATATTPPAAATPNAIATADGEKSGLRVDVTELKRSSGGTVMMKFTLANNSQENVGFHGHWLGDNAAGG